MGEIAEMTLDGYFCQGCGDLLVYPGEEPAGFPQHCSPECAGEQAPKKRRRRRRKRKPSQR